MELQIAVAGRVSELASELAIIHRDLHDKRLFVWAREADDNLHTMREKHRAAGSKKPAAKPKADVKISAFPA